MTDALSRRAVLTRGAAVLATATVAVAASEALAQNGAKIEMPAAALPKFPVEGFDNGEYTLPPLPYPYEALEPHIDKETMMLHHDKHHKAYVDGLNKTLKELAAVRAAPGEINVSALTGLQEDLSFNGSGHILHTLFWKTMAPNAGGEPGGQIADALRIDFGSVEAFRTHFSKGAAGVKGSGWAILAYEPLGDKLIVLQAKQHDLQTIFGVVPLLPLDVWEHAYYLKYHNVRPEYVKAWWNVVNWPAVESLYLAAKQTRAQTKPA